MPKLSIIIPVQNGEQYLRECITSACQQMLRDLEILLIVGPSTDQSLAICEEFQKQDSRVKLITTSSTDSAVAKNVGINNASGETITFVNQADTINPDFAVLLTTIIDGNNCDIANSDFIEGGVGTPLANNDNTFNGVYTSSQWLEISSARLFHLAYSSWGRIYRRKIFRDLRFTTGVNGAEDKFTIWQADLLADRISFSNFYGYNLRRSPQFESLTEIRAVEEQIGVMNILGLRTDYLVRNYSLLLHQLARFDANARVKLKLLEREGK